MKTETLLNLHAVAIVATLIVSIFAMGCEELGWGPGYQGKNPFPDPTYGSNTATVVTNALRE